MATAFGFPFAFALAASSASRAAFSSGVSSSGGSPGSGGAPGAGCGGSIASRRSRSAWISFSVRSGKSVTSRMWTSSWGVVSTTPAVTACSHMPRSRCSSSSWRGLNSKVGRGRGP